VRVKTFDNPPVDKMIRRGQPLNKRSSPMPEGKRIKMVETYGRLLSGQEYVVDPTTADGLIAQNRAVGIASRAKRRRRTK